MKNYSHICGVGNQLLLMLNISVLDFEFITSGVLGRQE